MTQYGYIIVEKDLHNMEALEYFDLCAKYNNDKELVKKELHQYKLQRLDAWKSLFHKMGKEEFERIGFCRLCAQEINSPLILQVFSLCKSHDIYDSHH